MADERKLPRWDLSDLFSGPDDPCLKTTLTGTLARGEALSSRYHGRMAELAPADLLTALREYEGILNEAIKPLIFAHLMHEADALDARLGQLLAFTEKGVSDINKATMFFGLEVAKLEPARLTELAAAPELVGYRNYLNQAKAVRPHTLAEELEKLITDKDRTGAGTLIRLLDEELAAMTVEVEIAGETKQLTEATALDLIHDHDRATRLAAANGFTAALHEQTRRLSLIVNALMDDKASEDEWRHYEDAEQARHLVNQADRAGVQAMTDAVCDAYAQVADYYKFKREVMGLGELFDYDRYAPIGEPQAAIGWDEAKQTVKDAYQRFSPELAKHVAEMMDRGWIDVGPRPGKRGGAFCQFATPDLHPYVLLNYAGRPTDVMTLAHELGHAAHARLMRHQTPLNFDAPITMCETASVFGETLVFEALKAKLDDRDRLALIMGRIEEIIATVFRQTSMFLFERDLHAARRTEGELTPERIDGLWRASQVPMFGDSVTLRPDYDRWWLYITHFWHTPFYVYGYVFGELLTLALYAKYRTEGEAFVPKYLAVLTAGNSASPQEILAPLGIDLADRAFWEGGLKSVADLIAEAKELHKSLRA